MKEKGLHKGSDQPIESSLYEAFPVKEGTIERVSCGLMPHIHLHQMKKGF